MSLPILPLFHPSLLLQDFLSQRLCQKQKMRFLGLFCSDGKRCLCMLLENLLIALRQNKKMLFPSCSKETQETQCLWDRSKVSRSESEKVEGTANLTFLKALKPWGTLTSRPFVSDTLCLIIFNFYLPYSVTC